MARARTTPPTNEDEAAPDEVEEFDTSDPLTIHQALVRVMGEVQSISKASRNTSQNFNFRGIDAVMNAVGPALREHGVVVLPVGVKSEIEQYQTKNGTAMKNVTLDVTFRFYGPAGDYIEGTTRGEAADSGDKATAKAHSVAFRTLLLQALCIPTDEPDPDQDSHERVHESGFERGAAADPKPQRERRQDAPAYNFPKDWKELGARMASLVGVEESVVWMTQAKEIVTGDAVTPTHELEVDAQREVWAVLTQTLRTLETTESDLQLHPTPRETISEAFSLHLDGQILNGPTWALTGAEAEKGYPAKETTASDEVGKQEAPEQEPTDEQAAEAQAALDLEAAAAAEAAE